MYDTLIKVAVGVGAAALTYWGADTATKYVTGKHIHEHVLDCLPVWFKNKILSWCNAYECVGVRLRYLADDARVYGKRILKAVGVLKDPRRLPVKIEEGVISSEEAKALGFDINETDIQEMACMMA
jgi:hypothetical protein